MIIVSPNRKIINFENLAEIYISEYNLSPLEKSDTKRYYLNGTILSGKYTTLGGYKTEERAKEVLQEIIKTYLGCNEQNHLAEFAYVKNKVYKMPEE